MSSMRFRDHAVVDMSISPEPSDLIRWRAFCFANPPKQEIMRFVREREREREEDGGGPDRRYYCGGPGLAGPGLAGPGRRLQRVANTR